MDRYFDTHCHLQCPHFDADRNDVINRARKSGVRMLTLGTDAASSRQCSTLAENHPGVWAAVGIHPNDSADATDEDLAVIRELAGHDKTVALGETGLDYYRDRAPKARQQELLDWHLALARELNLPVALHARDSGADLLDRIEPFLQDGGRAVWHCFVAGKKKMPGFLERAIEHELYLGISGLVTFEDQKPLHRIVAEIPDRLLLLDTDSPYLIPRPRQVDRNEPTQCVRIVERLAELRGVTPDDIARITMRNACTFLGLPLPDEEEKAKIAYPIRNSLYLALTNDCTNDCTFCARNRDYIVKGHNIRLARDPSAEEVIDAMGETARYDEVVFCGYGEPTMRLDVLKAVARHLKAQGQTVRLNTNGQGSLYHKRDIAPELAGLVDVVSVSLNSADPAQYAALCRSRFGAEGYAGMCDFVRRCLAAGIRTICSVVAMPDIDVEAARAKTAELGAEFRVRSFLDAG